jgi:anaphase-promoting complex subunit 2
MFSNPGLSRSRKRVFDSVFPPASLKDIAPTPTATPLLGSTGPGQPFGFGIQTEPSTQEYSSLRSPGGHGSSGLKTEDSSPEQVVWNRAWHTATTFLSFPNHGFRALMETDLTDNGLLERWLPSNPVSRETRGALTYLLSSSSQGRSLRADSKKDDLLEWYGNEIRRHFLANFRSGLVKVFTPLWPD